jgi:hypothetical protein
VAEEVDLEQASPLVDPKASTGALTAMAALFTSVRPCWSRVPE